MVKMPSFMPNMDDTHSDQHVKLVSFKYYIHGSYSCGWQSKAGWTLIHISRFRLFCRVDPHQHIASTNTLFSFDTQYNNPVSPDW